MRLLLEEIVSRDPRLELMASCDTAEEAIKIIPGNPPDVLSMDILLPGMDGLSAIHEILASIPIPIVVISSTTSSAESRHAMEALHAGALAVLPKPEGPGSPDFPKQARKIADQLYSMSQVRVMRRMKSVMRSREASHPPAAPVPPPPGFRVDGGVRAVGIAASTGGPVALVDLLSPLPADYPLPVLLVQHIAPGFAPSFASWLQSCIRLRVKCATDGELLEKGVVYLAPDGFHLAVNGTRVALLDSPPVGVHRPSATVLFESLARHYGARAAGVILTGMGGDGAEGLLALRRRGAWTAGQEEASCAVFGMPMAARDLGAVTGLFSLPILAQHLLNLKPCTIPQP